MRTIVEPKEFIAKLWGKQKINYTDTFRMMRYVIRDDYDGKVLLHNVVTGQLVVLDQREAELLNKLPLEYCSEMERLVENHYLVTDQFDENRQVVKMREVLRKLDEVQRKPGIIHYTILPTTACNARCYYCFEHGSKIVTMSEQTANSVVDYIDSHCALNRQVSISWFGGEPTVASKRIDQICEGLKNKGIQITSDITTNGYLFDEELAIRARKLWNLQLANITIDGTENTYNRIKSYVDAKDNPYIRVLTNVGLLLEQRIRVSLRMNFDLGNYHEFKDLIKDKKNRFGENPLIQIHVHPIIGQFVTNEGVVSHGSDKWFEEKIVELNDMARNAGLLKPKDELPYLKYKGCQANNKSAATITPEGSLVRCPEQYGDEQVAGNIWAGVTNSEIVQSWQVFSEYPKCKECVLFPYCVRLSRCSAQDRCCYLSEFIQQYQKNMKHKLCSYKKAR